MGRPLAYEYYGFAFNEQIYNVWRDDADVGQYYVMPQAVRVAEDASGPKVTVSVCETLSKPAVDGLANLAANIPADAMKALQAQYGKNIAPLPVSTGGQVMITGPNWTRRGLAVAKPWLVDDLALPGLSPEQKAKIQEVKSLYNEHGIEAPLTSLLVGGEGWALEVPQMVGSNIGAEVPLAFTVLGADNVKRLKGLLDAPGGGVINGQLLYHYVGTMRPWSLQVHADLSKVHQYISDNLKAGFFWAKADIHRAIEQMRAQSLIDVTVWDEGGTVTGKYKPEQIFDTILQKILEKAFNFYPDIKPEKSQAQAEGGRFWWWSGSYSRNSSTVDLSELFNIRITIYGRSEPIPVSCGIFLRVPKYGNCDQPNLVHDARLDLLRIVNDRNIGATLASVSALKSTAAVTNHPVPKV
jgi:hypothetical protein